MQIKVTHLIIVTLASKTDLNNGDDTNNSGDNDTSNRMTENNQETMIHRTNPDDGEQPEIMIQATRMMDNNQEIMIHRATPMTKNGTKSNDSSSNRMTAGRKTRTMIQVNQTLETIREYK